MSATSLSTALLFVATTSSTVALHLDSITVPPKAGVGASVTLKCPYLASPTQVVFSVSWWKDNDKFYEFDLRHNRGPDSYEFEGIDVDMDQSNEHQVTLRSLSIASSGEYTCEIVSDVTFEKVNRSAAMLVLEGFSDSIVTDPTPETAGTNEILEETFVQQVLKLPGMVVTAVGRVNDPLKAIFSALVAALGIPLRLLHLVKL